MANKWRLKGDYVEACNCDIACQCIWLEPPDNNACTASLAWQIHEGQYGEVDLDGISVAMFVSTEEGVMFEPGVGWHVVLLIDEEADESQRAALEDIFFGRAGGIWSVVADAHLESTEVVSVPISFTRDGTDVSVSIGDVGTIEVTGKLGFNEEIGAISPHPLTEDLKMNTGKSRKATVSHDEDFNWDVSGNNAYLGDFELTNA